MNTTRRFFLLASMLTLTACQTPPEPQTQAQPQTQTQSQAQTQPQAQPQEQPQAQPQAQQADNSQAKPINAPPNRPQYNTTSPTHTGDLQHPELIEVSGLATSTRRNDVLWAINDSGNQPKLYALSQTGASLGSFNVAARNRDWEDLASAWINGNSYLLIADIGDNLRNKDEHAIYIVREPQLDGQVAETLSPVHTLRFRYPDKPHNAEALAYANGWVYILTKESLARPRHASQVFRIPMRLHDTNQLHVASKIAELAVPPGSVESSLIASLGGVDISQPTAFAIDALDCHAYVLTYRAVYQYERNHEQDWAEVLAQPRVRLYTHSLAQAEALAVSDNGIVWITSERTPAPLWALPGGREDSCG